MSACHIKIHSIWLVETVSLNQAVKQYYSMVVGAKLVESWADFFGSVFSRFGSVLERLSVVCVFPLSSLRFHIVVSGGASTSF